MLKRVKLTKIQVTPPPHTLATFMKKPYKLEKLWKKMAKSEYKMDKSIIILPDKSPP